MSETNEENQSSTLQRSDSIASSEETVTDNRLLSVEIAKHGTSLVETIARSLDIIDEISDNLEGKATEALSTFLDDVKNGTKSVEQLYQRLEELHHQADSDLDTSLKKMFEEFLRTSDQVMEDIGLRIEKVQQEDEEDKRIEQELKEAQKCFDEQMKRYQELMQRRKDRRTANPKSNKVSEEPNTSSQKDNIEENKGVAEFGAVNKLAESIVKSVNSTHRRRNTVEPSVFNGDVLQFIDWEADLDDYIEEEQLSEKEALRILKNKLLAGAAREAVSGLFYQNSSEAYREVRAKLKQRYGDKFSASRALRKKLTDWPKINNKDSDSLMRFADLLSNCHACMKSMKELHILHDVEENEKLVEKLPEWIKSKWARIVRKTKREESRYPDFGEFMSFVVEEAEVMSEPILRKGSQNAHTTQPAQKSQKSQKETSTRVLNTSADSTSEASGCVCCKKTNHETAKCFFLEKKPYEERVSFVKDHRLCFGCLKQGHSSKNCKNRSECKKCGKKHPSSLHDNNRKTNSAPTKTLDSKTTTPKTEQPTNDDKVQKSEKEVSVKNTLKGASTFSMVVPVYVSGSTDHSDEKLVYALLDSQSDASFIVKRVAQEINAYGQKERVTISTLTGRKTEEKLKYSNLSIRGYNTNNTAVLSAYEQSELPCDKTTIPTISNCPQAEYLQAIRDKLPPQLDIPIGMLIGTDCPEALAPHDSVPGPTGQAFALKTIFGWTLCGGQQDNQRKTVHKIATITSSSSLDEDREDLKLSQDDIKFLEVLENGTVKENTGHLKMPLPFRSRPKLPNNMSQAKKRFEVLERVFQRDGDHKAQYSQFIEDMLEQNHAEVVPDTEPQAGELWYWPHFGVKHAKKKKLRVVFDCSARFHGQAINDHLLQGPDHINNLVGILLRFRQERVAVSCDIQKMFYNFHVDERDRDYLRFLWYGKDNQIQEYRMRVHIFGAKSSPGVATFGLRKLATEHKESSPEAYQFICEDFYVDDGIVSIATEEEAVDLIKKVTDICRKGGLRLHKFMTNSQKVLETIPPSERSAEDIDVFEDKSTQRTLGLEWGVKKDILLFHNTIQAGPSTKRGILSAVSQIFDPLGYLAPFVLKGKMLLQEVCKTQVDWNDAIDDKLDVRWQNWLAQLEFLSRFQLNRCFKPIGFEKPSRTEIHYFSDASSKGYGVCAYIRLINSSQEVHCNIVMAKARVAPQKIQTIPRMELQAAQMAAQMSAILREELRITIDEEYFWSDSKIVLGWLKNEATRFHVFVANRVQRIKNLTTNRQWNYIQTTSNPADLASRGADLEALLQSKWLQGPDFLWEINIESYLNSETSFHVDEDDPEMKRIKTCCTHTDKNGIWNEKSQKFSDYSKLLSAVAHICKRVQKRSWKTTDIEAVDMLNAEKIILRDIQQEFYGAEIEAIEKGQQIDRKSKLIALDPKMDDDKLLRIGGRAKRSLALTFNEKHPVVVPKNAHIATLLVRHFHEKVHHQGKNLTIGALRQAGYWITGAQQLVRSILNKCVTCRASRGNPLMQKMGNLPKERIEPTAPFTNVGVDIFGPFTVKERRKQIKCWGAIFTCLYSRAIHLELVDDLTTDCFLNTLRCFQAIRGPVKTIFCDQGTNLVGAKNLMEKELKEMSEGALKRYLKKNMIEFKMNVPSASHRGGAWERQIRTTRAVLNNIIGKHQERLDISTLRTALYESMAIVNSRPLASDGLSSPYTNILTPNHLLTGKTLQLGPPPGEFSETEVYGRHRWRKSQQIAEEFWQQWSTQYLANITKRQRWEKETKNVKVGDVVSVVDGNKYRSQWLTGTVEKVNMSEDGLVRAATIRIPNTEDGSQPTILERPIQKLILILSC